MFKSSPCVFFDLIPLIPCRVPEIFTMNSMSRPISYPFVREQQMPLESKKCVTSQSYDSNIHTHLRPVLLSRLPYAPMPVYFVVALLDFYGDAFPED